jgi:hypothetical protein
VRFALAADPRYGSPQMTWFAFIGALLKGDREAALACFTSAAREKWQPTLAALSPEDMKRMAESVKQFTVTGGFGGYMEAIASRADGQAGFIMFAQRDGEWRIDEM